MAFSATMLIMDMDLSQQLIDYFKTRDDTILAYLFGSQAKGIASPVRSDYDIAVYFKPKTGVFEYEESEYSATDYSYEAENTIQTDLELITGKDVDLVVLNRAPAYLVASVLKTGITLKESDRAVFLELWMRSLSDAEDYRVFFKEYKEIMLRSHSLSVEDKVQLEKITTFLLLELQALKECGAIDQLTYMQVSTKRKILERTIEVVVNAGLDIGKILLASHKRRIPDKYADIMIGLVGIEGFDEAVARSLAASAGLRNFIAHEYLDYRYKNIRRFVDSAQHDFRYLIDFAEKILKAE